MKRLMLFLQEVLQDLGDWCRTSTTLDYKTIERRVEHEGMSFLTISLANFGSDLQRALDQGFVADDLFAGFSRRGGLPKFLWGFLRQVFDSQSGRLLDDPSVDCIFAIRQITLMFGKILLPCTPEREKKALRNYVECEQIVREAYSRLDPLLIADFRRMRSLLWQDVIDDVGTRLMTEPPVPKHGPGATADGLRGNAKWRQREWTTRLEREFNSVDFLIPNPRYRDALDSVSYLEPGQERPVKVVLVPKTLKTPRVIAEEPTCMQYVQQGLLEMIEESIMGHDIPRRLVSWRSREPNWDLARQGSLTGEYATLDLSDASDRVSNQHVLNLFGNGILGRGVQACRSRKADVPGHGVIRLAKFASMGSALTFPVEAMVFATIVFLGIESELNRRMTKKDIEYLSRRVRVYGDDIIVPVEYVHSVVTYLSDFGLKVNVNKSYWNGKFRETCGKEYYGGHDVSITRVRRELPSHRLQSSEIVSTVRLRNHLYQSGLWRAARWLDSLLEGLGIPYPRVLESSPVLGRESIFGYEIHRWHKDTQTPLVRGLRVRSPIPKSGVGDIHALLKVLTKRGDLPIADVRHLSFAGRPRSVSTKIGWYPPF